MKTDKNTALKLQKWFEHSQQRAMERYGMAYTDTIRMVIKLDVKNNVFNTLYEVPNSQRAVLRGRVVDRVVTFIYCQKYETVITFLQNSWVKGDSESEFYLLSEKERTKKRAPTKSKSTKLSGKIKLWSGKRRKISTPKKRSTKPNKFKLGDHLDEHFQ